jgi:hypothetical protein
VKMEIHSMARALGVACLLVLPVACTADEPADETATATGAAPAAEPAAGSAESPAPADASEAASADAPYTVECGKNAETGENQCLVDKMTYVGWRTFNSTCYVCHGQDAVGTTFAPSLIERLKVIDKPRFMDVVANGFTGQVGVMPPWKDNPNVNKRFEELYAYVKARSDGALPAGRPERKPE